MYAAIFIAVILGCFAWWEFKKRHKRRHFDENGGVVLKGVGIAMFTERQLKKITNDYSNRIGKGAYGEVYKGTNDRGEQVAVKRPVAKRTLIGKDEFVKEITFQFRISHPNIVRLVGCCLETEVPILVFEFVPRGSLYDVLHGGDGQMQLLKLPERLDIAIGSAEALSYMHSHAEHHVHGDIKTANILLNSDHKPKVSDFGSSKLLAMGMYSRSVAADMSYVDPVYMKTGRFTDKSDVYSFGVVLLELITRKTAKYDGNRSLPMDFVSSCKDDEGSIRRAMYDKDILAEGSGQSQLHLECLEMIGELAVRCLRDYIEERPPMAEVVEELKKVKRHFDEAGN
jgi:serine/threonine protein kinase